MSQRRVDWRRVFPPLCPLPDRSHVYLACNKRASELGIINRVRGPRPSVPMGATPSLRFSLFFRGWCKETLDGENRHGRSGLFPGSLCPLHLGLVYAFEMNEDA